jgi:DNA-binding NarL/FixJ family response regulator
MPGFGGIEATRRILDSLPEAQVLALTIDGTRAGLLGALGAGMAGFVLKDTPVDDIAGALMAAREGDVPISPRAARNLVGHLRRTSRTPVAPAVDPQLTDRELDVLALMSDGCSNASIAEQLMVSPHTVKTHVSRVLEKLGCTNRVQAVVRAHREDLLRPWLPLRSPSFMRT